MKKLTLLSAALFLSTFLFSQWEVGPRIGVNFSKISGQYSNEDKYQHKWITGMVAGGFATYNINDMFSLCGELLFINSGEKTISHDNGIDATKSSRKYNNLEIPFLFKFTFGEETQFYAEIGPYFAYNLGGKYTIEVESANFIQEGKLKFSNEPEGYYDGSNWNLDTDRNRRCDFGVYYGIGAQRKLGPGKLSFDFRFGHGFLGIYKWQDENDKPEGYKPYKNKNISLSFGYSIPLGNS